MRIGLGIALVASVVAGTVSVSAGWLQQSRTGLGQLLRGTIATSPSGSVGRGPMLADWHDPQAKANATPIAMSESEWLMLADEVAPVSYLSEKPASGQPDTTGEQQPL
jgi:hypothetical protein